MPDDPRKPVASVTGVIREAKERARAKADVTKAGSNPQSRERLRKAEKELMNLANKDPWRYETKPPREHTGSMFTEDEPSWQARMEGRYQAAKENERLLSAGAPAPKREYREKDAVDHLVDALRAATAGRARVAREGEEDNVPAILRPR